MATADSIVILGIPDRSIARDVIDRLKNADHDRICVVEDMYSHSEVVKIESHAVLIDWKTDLVDIASLLPKPLLRKQDALYKRHWASKNGLKARVCGKRRHRIRNDRRMTQR